MGEPPLDLGEVEARLQAIGAPYSGAVTGQEWTDLAAVLMALRATRSALARLISRTEQVAWTRRSMAEVSQDAYWSFVPTDAVRSAGTVLAQVRDAP